jgi:hypothetical protein
MLTAPDMYHHLREVQVQNQKNGIGSFSLVLEIMMLLLPVGNNYGTVPWQTKKWYSNYPFQVGATYSFTYDFTSYINFSGVGGAIFQIQILDSSLNVLASKM